MGKQTWTQNRPDRAKTREQIHEALSDVQHAVRPNKKRTVRDALSWVAALGAGAAFAWRSFQAGRESLPDGRDNALANSTQPRLLAQPAQSASPALRETAVTNTASSKTAPLASADKPASTAATQTAPKVEGGFVALVKEFGSRYSQDDIGTHAAALSFTGIFSLVPLLLLALAVLGFFIHSPQQAEAYVQRFINNLLPGQQASQAASNLLQQTHIVESAQTLMHGKWWAIVFGILSLLWAGISLFVTASGPMNAAWDVQETRSFVKLRLVCLETFALAGLLFVLSLALSSDWPHFLHPRGAAWYITVPLNILSEVIAVGINAGMFFLIYRLLPNTNVSAKAAGFGAIVVGVFYELFKKGFEIYLAHFGNFDKLYGTLGGVFLLITWIYYGCMVLLAGAELCKMYHEHREEGGVAKRSAA